jgi:hypothetical protein
VSLTPVSSGVPIAVVPTSNNDGTYTVDYQLTVKDTYSLSVQYGGVNLLNTPVTGITVDVGLVQAKQSLLVSSTSPIVAGQ